MGGSVKRQYIKDIIWKEQVDMVCIQETKSRNLELALISSLWGSNDVGWVENEAHQNVGSLLTMWCCNSFELTSFINGANYSIVEGLWKERGRKPIIVVNVYGCRTLCEKSKA